MKQSKRKTALRAVKMSLQIKFGLSKAVLILGIPAAFLPALIAKWLQAFTDELLRLQSGGSTVAFCLELLLVLVIFFLIQLCMQALRQYTDEEDQVRGTRELKRTLLKCKCEVCYPYIENEDKFQERLEMVNKFAGEQTIRSVSMVMNLLTTTITFVSIIVLLWAVNPWIVVLIIFTTFPAAWITYKQNNETFFQNLTWSEKGAMVILYYGLMAEEKHIQELRHYGLYPYLLKRWHAFSDSYCKEKRELLTKHTLMNGVADVVRNIVYAAVLLVTAWQIYENPGLGLGLFTMVFSLTGQMQTAASNLFVGTAGFLSTLPYMQEFFYLQDLPKDYRKKETEMIKKGDIQCEHVSFTYSGAERQALSDVSISIQDGEKIAIVGDNGSGKSTFISLLCGMLQPDSGSIRIGGESMEAEPEKIRNSISVVFQDFAHYEDTLRNNITVSDPEKTSSDEELNQLLKELHVDAVINQQQLGLDSKLGSFSENSNNLSGGQWQKIALARAAYRNQGRIIILDEPTSALDPMAEAQLYKDFAEITGDKTTLLISHRLGITSVVDRILVFRDGKLIEDGSHQELMEKDGYYAKMYRAQAKWYQ